MRAETAENIDSEFYQRHLDRVSRSFAFCILQLREPLRARVGLAYLICRLLDTVEDSKYPDVAIKFEQLRQFNRFMEQAPEPGAVQKWLDESPTGIPEGERELLMDAARIFSDFHALPEADKRAMRDTVLSMSHGMAYFLEREKDGGLRLENLADVNRYCFFVAGVVGELLSKLFANRESRWPLSESTLLRSHQFGLYLQKINVLKDQLDDEKQGRFLVPSQEEMWASVRGDAEGAIQYILSIPVEARDYRLFCAWSLFLGLASVPFIRKSWARRLMDKIPRSVTEQILKEVTAGIDDNQKLRVLFDRHVNDWSADWQSQTRAALKNTGDFKEFSSLYVGHVPTGHLEALGMKGLP